MHYLIFALIEEAGVTVEINGFPAHHETAYSKHYIQKRIDPFLKPGENEVKVVIDNPQAAWFLNSGMRIDLSIRGFAEDEVIDLHSGKFCDLTTNISDEDVTSSRPLNLLEPSTTFKFSLDKSLPNNIGVFGKYLDGGDSKEVEDFCNQIRSSFEGQDIDWLMKHTSSGIESRLQFYGDSIEESKMVVEEAFKRYSQMPLKPLQVPNKPVVKAFLNNKVWATSATAAWSASSYMPLLTFLNPETEKASGKMDIYIGRTSENEYGIIFY